MMRFLILLVPMAACAEAPVPRPSIDAGTTADAGPAPDAGTLPDAAIVDTEWHDDHCRDRECFYIMQGVAGANDLVCNGRHPVDVGTQDDTGLRNCPFASFANARLRRLMAPTDAPNVARSFFLGAGRYAAWPDGLLLRGDGAEADEAVWLTNYRGAEVTIDGASCPASCSIETPDGIFTKSPCCSLDCSTCDAHPDCRPIEIDGVDSGACGIPWDKVYRPFTVMGSWVRVEGISIEGCANDAVVVSARFDQDGIVPNGEIFISNNRIGGCDINENIKAFAQGPGPLQGGPTWGRTHVIGNEMFDMNSQAVDATGVHNWVVEENWIHDAKTVHPIPGQEVDGGGIGFKNGGSRARVRNNWLVRGGSFALGGGSASCARSKRGCFQSYEMTDMVVENNMAIESAMAATSGSGAAIGVFHCDGCGAFGNVLTDVATKHGVYISDECPGPRCAYNPRLQPTRNFALAANFITLGAWEDSGRLFMGYPRDVHPNGPGAHGMVSADNVFCAGTNTPPKLLGTGAPAESIALWYHFDPNANMPLLPDFAPMISDTGSMVFADTCPAAPPVCNVAFEDDEVRWDAPACPSCTCALVVDERTLPVDCDGRHTLDTPDVAPGRHYVGLRVSGPMATGCGLSFDVESEARGAGCRIHVEGTDVRWAVEGGVSCTLLADGGVNLGDVPCTGTRPLAAALTAPGRHRVQLRVNESALGQTTCGAMFQTP